MASSSRTILKPNLLTSLQKFFQKERPNLIRSPILLISSEPAVLSTEVTNVAKACQHVEHMLAQQLSMRTVPSKVSTAFATQADVAQKIELAHRTGASSIVAVGSGAAMDVAKAVMNTTAGDGTFDHLVMIPSTSAAIMATVTPHSLLLDVSAEQTLVPHPTSAPFALSSATTTIAPLESSLVAMPSTSTALFAASAIALDVIYRQSIAGTRAHESELALSILQRSLDLLQQQDDPGSMHEDITQLLFDAGSLISYGIDDNDMYQDRSIPIALASSLIPTIFPHVHVLNFWASLVPGLCALVQEYLSSNATIQAFVETVHQHNALCGIPEMTVADEFSGFSVPDMAKTHVQSNQALWRCRDVPDFVLMEVLQQGNIRST